MEVWHRKKRQFLCNHEIANHYSTSKSICLVSDEDLQIATCADTKKPLAEAFKNDIECGWGAADRCHAHMTFIIAVIVAYIIL